jgi:drug/metabolite transporter (DMT)-like permease
VSGLFGIGLGDTGYFQALPRLGSRRTVLLTQCFIPLFAILIEWLWLGTTLTVVQLLCIAVILTGVALALTPHDHAKIPARQLWIGIAFAVFAAFCGALGAVFSRKAWFVAHDAGEFPDPGTTGYQRVLGGLLIPGILLLAVKWRSARSHGGVFEEKTFQVSRKMEAHLAVDSGQQPRRPDARRDLRAMGARKNADGHRDDRHRADARSAAADDAHRRK